MSGTVCGVELLNAKEQRITVDECKLVFVTSPKARRASRMSRERRPQYRLRDDLGLAHGRLRQVIRRRQRKPKLLSRQKVGKK
jgi:hypothetical protein